MFRRSRLSIRPNVGIAGRTGGTPQETSSNKDPDNSKTNIETPICVTDNKPADSPKEQTPGTDQNGEATSSSAIQRRKRFSVRPKVVPGRPSALPCTPKSQIKPIVKSPVQVIDKAEALIEANSTASHQELSTPNECQPSNENRLSAAEIISPSEVSSKSLDHSSKIQSSSCSQVKEISLKSPVPPSIPDRETIDISEKAKTLVSKTDLKTPSQHFSLTQLLNDKSDLLRLEKARKLRQLLKQEMLKEKSKKYIARMKECTVDPSKMTMRDLIHYLPTCNPMSCSLNEESVQENENESAIPQSPGRETSPERVQEQEVQPKVLSPCHKEATATTSAEGEQDHEDEEAEEAEEAAEDDETLMVPQVKVAEDGSLIIDEESLTVEVKRMKGPNPIQDRDPIFERGSTTTYSSFRKGTHTKPWSTEETDMFFLAISMVGTDFAMISQLFPHRARSEIKNKFKKEERYNAWRIDKAFRERRKLDLEYFKKLLEKIIEYQQNKKKLKAVSEKPKRSKRKSNSEKRRAKKGTTKLSDVEEENEDGDFIEEEEEEEEEGEKENLCHEKASTSKTQCKRKRKDVLSSEVPVDKKKKKKMDDATALVDLGEVDSEGHLSLDQAKKTDKQAAKTPKAKAGKPLTVGRKGLKSKKSKAVVSDTEGETTSEETEKKFEKDLRSPQQSAKRMSDSESSDHGSIVQSVTPSRYGRIPKPVHPLNYPAKEDDNSAASDTVSSPARPTTSTKPAKNKAHGKRRKLPQQKTVKESKKRKLITLRASQSEGSDDDDDEGEEKSDALHFDDENGTSAFVPASLCSPKPVIPEVQESMEELDILAHMPDVLGISKNSLCPDASCEQVQNERDSVEPCEHQLDLLVDVIDFLSEHTEVSDDEDYNEAAQTLLEIGNLTSLAQPIEGQPSLPDDKSKFESSHCNEVDDLPESTFEHEECTVLVSEPSMTENVQTNFPMEQTPIRDISNAQDIEPEDLPNTEDTSSSTHLSTLRTKNSLPPRKGRLSKIKPRPNIGSATRTAKHLPQTNDDDQKSQQVALTSLQSSEQLKEATAVSEPLMTDRPADDTTVVIDTSLVSDLLMSDEPCCTQDAVDSLQLQKTHEPPMNSSPQMRPRLPKVKPNIGFDLTATKQTIESFEENPQIENELIATSQLMSSEDQEESTQAFSEQDEPEILIPQLGPLNANNSSVETKAVPSKIKGCPSIGSASRTTNLASQSVHVDEEKLQDESELTSQLGVLEHQVEIAQSVSELSNIQNNIANSPTDDTLASQASDKQVSKNSSEPSTTQEAPPTSQFQPPCSKNPTVPRKGRFSKIKPTPNIESASRTKRSSQSVNTMDDKQTVSETSNTTQLQSLAPSCESVVETCRNSLKFDSKVTETNQSHTSSNESNTFETHLYHFTEMSCSSVQSTVEPLQQEPETMPLIQSEHASTEEATENIPPVQLSDPSSQSLTHSKPQKRRWVPKVKPKPNLVSSPRTTKARLESKDMSEEPDELVQPSVNKATAEQPMLRDISPAETPDHLQSAHVKPMFTFGVSSGEDMTTLSTDTNQANVDSHKLMECAPPDSKFSQVQHLREDLTYKNTEICLISNTSNVPMENSEINNDHIRPAEGAVDFSTELQCNDAAQFLGPGQMQDSSAQSSIEYRGLLFPNIPPDQVPSDPDEPFFILSLTEIPVCPSGEEVVHVDPRPESYHVPHREIQQSNPVVPLAAGIDDSLSNIHIPTPEKATLKSGLICVEEYLSSEPSIDISLLEEPQERQNLSEAESNVEHLVSLTDDKQPSRGDDKKCSRRQSVMRKAADKKNNIENTTPDPTESLTLIESCEVVDSQTQRDDHVRKTKTKSSKSQAKNTVVACESSESQSSGTLAANVFTCPSSSRTYQPTSAEHIDPNLNDSGSILEEEPTSMSEYFFGDVFTEVESDCLDTRNISENIACQNKAQSQSVEKKTSLQQDSNLRREQKTLEMPEARTDEATSSNLPACPAAETTVCLSPRDKKPRGRGKGNANRKTKTSSDAKDEKSRPPRKSTTAKLPKSLSQDNVKACTPSSSTVPPQSHETTLRSLKNTSAEILDQNDSVESNLLEEEPTVVSHYYFSDVFTEVQSNELTDTGKSSTYSSGSCTTPSQKTGKKLDEKQTGKTFTEPSERQESSWTEAQPPDATSSTSFSLKIQNTPSPIDVATASGQQDNKKTRGKGRSKKKSKELCERSLTKSTEELKNADATAQGSKVQKDSPEKVDCGSTSLTETINISVESVDKTQASTSETSRNTRKKRKTKASSGRSIIQVTAHESITDEVQKAKTEKTKGKESCDGNKVDEAPSGSSSMEQSELQTTNQNISEESSLFDDEPTNVSQYFLSDIFTDVDEEFKS